LNITSLSKWTKNCHRIIDSFEPKAISYHYIF
jgi:hypothetical protein